MKPFDVTGPPAGRQDHCHGGLAADFERLLQQTARRRVALRWLAATGAAGSGLLGLGGIAG